MPTPMTKNGEAMLQEELEHLKRVARPKVVADISEARAHGDLKENAEYHAAKEQQGFIEGRIQDIESKLSDVVVIDVTERTNDGKVIFGSTVTLIDIDTDEEVTYHIVGEDEADVEQGKISVNAPIARAVIGKAVDTEVEVQTPNGPKSFEIYKVEYI